MSFNRKPLSQQIYESGQVAFDHHKRAYFHAANRKAITLLYLLISTVFWSALWVFCHFFIHFEWIGSFLGFLAMVLIGASWWYSRITAYYMNEEEMTFWLAFRTTIYSVVLKLAFVPVIGSLFERVLKSKSLDENGGDNQS